MYSPAGVATSPELSIPAQMKAWVLGDPDQLSLRDKPTPVPRGAEVLVRIDRGEGRSATRRAMALMAEKRFDATKIHTHTFVLADLPTALRYAATGARTPSRWWSRRGQRAC